MNHRQRADQRLSFYVPHLQDGEARALFARLVERTVEHGLENHQPPGASVRVRDPAKQTVRQVRGVETEPNAPLLMRLVRHPYAHETTQFTRIDYREPFVRERAEPLGAALAYLEELRGAYQFVSPMKANPHRPEDRPLPFVKARRAAEARHE